MAHLPDWLSAARDHWQWRGAGRPPFAQVPEAGQTSVWDFPRPPRLAPDTREVVIRWSGVEVARTRRALRVLETSHPPSFYLPRADVATRLLVPAGGGSFCEWKGPASYWTLRDGDRQLPRVAWSYPQPLAGAEALADCIAFYPSALECRVDGDLVRPQPGGFYGGWITSELVGPFKGEPGSEGVVMREPRRSAPGGRRALLIGLAAIAVSTAAPAADPGFGSLRDGAVVLLRHADAPGIGDPPGFDLANCRTQRNLNAAGRAQARRIGAAFRAHGVDVRKVLHSQWCRTRDTAELAFPGLAREDADFNSFFDDDSGAAARTARARATLAAWAGPGVLVVVTHQVNITALTGVVPASGEAVIVRARPGEARLDVIARLRP